VKQVSLSLKKGMMEIDHCHAKRKPDTPCAIVFSDICSRFLRCRDYVFVVLSI